MKKLSLLSLLFVCLFALSSCGDDDDGPTFFVKATVNGDEFDTGAVTGALTGPFIIITGTEGISEFISISIREDQTAGNYNLSLNSQDIVAAGYSSVSLTGNSVSIDAEAGMLTISAIDTSAQTVSGTFEFSGTDANSGETYSVLAGEFNAEYQ